MKLHTEAVEVKATQMEAKAETLEQQKEQLEQRTAELGQQREHLQQNNSKLLLTNLMLLNKAKHLEDHSRELVAKQEDLQHQVRCDPVSPYLMRCSWPAVFVSVGLLCLSLVAKSAAQADTTLLDMPASRLLCDVQCYQWACIPCC